MPERGTQRIPSHNFDRYDILEYYCTWAFMIKDWALVLIVLVLYLCYRLELINAIENVIGNLIAALVVLLGKN